MDYSKEEVLSYFEENVNYVRPMLMQWHITDQCNFRCRHCYQNSYQANELSLSELLKVLEQYKELLSQVTMDTRPFPVVGSVNITGGEPLMHRDFWSILSELQKSQGLFKYGILTNGSLIDHSVAGKLRDYGVDRVQVSIEGSKKTNDYIRGPGAYEKAIQAVKAIKSAGGIKTSISFTASKSNYEEFMDVVRLGCEIGAYAVWSDRMIPEGSGENMDALTPEDTRKYISLIRKAKDWASENGYETKVHMMRALQFLGRDDHTQGIYSCGAGDRGFTVMPNGDVYPCRRMPIPLGNIRQTTLKDLYYSNEMVLKLRKRDIVSNGCEACDYVLKCKGGLKCLSYALHETPFVADPGCYLAAQPTRFNPIINAN